MKTDDDLTLAGLVHDLNNVLQTLVDAADQLSEDPRWEHLSATILRSVERGRHIAQGLFETGGTGTPFEQILGNAISFVEDAILTARGPHIRFACDVEPGIVLGGNWAWERVLINLFLNSMRAMPRGGTIYVTAQRRGEEIEIAVADEGSGIPPHIVRDLFAPSVSGSGSTGLGLHIVETIVKQDGGRIRASNRAPQPGAEFVITLPAARAARLAV
jgi:signal transduction histidine kinase